MSKTVATMGCDYFTQVCTAITYVDASGVERVYEDYDEPERYYTHYYMRPRSPPPYDPDFEPRPTGYDMNELDALIASYGRKRLFADGVWHCLEAGRQRVATLCEEAGIPLESLRLVEKYLTGRWN